MPAQTTRKKARKPAAKAAKQPAPKRRSGSARPSARSKPAPVASRRPVREAVDEAVAWLRRKGTQRNRDGMARYAIPSDRAFGVSMNEIQALGKRLGQSHDLAAALWDTGWYEARTLTAFVEHRNAALHAAAVALARRLADSPDPAARWVGKDALRDLTRPAVARKLAARRGAKTAKE